MQVSKTTSSILRDEKGCLDDSNHDQVDLCGRMRL